MYVICKNGGSFVRRLLAYASDYRKQIILGPFFKFLEAIFELVLPLLMAKMIDQGIRAGNKGMVWEMVGWMVAMSIIGMICASICQYYSSIASQGFGTDIRNQLKIGRASCRERV